MDDQIGYSAVSDQLGFVLNRYLKYLAAKAILDVAENYDYSEKNEARAILKELAGFKK